jgi:hypothetical protein
MHSVSQQKSRLPNLDSKDDFERICAILSPSEPLDEEEEEFDPPEATPETITKYQVFLSKQLSAGLIMTGREDMGYFSWEERFTWGAGNSKEYEKLKQENASFTDKYELIRLVDWNREYGLIADVKRITDNKLFSIPLADLDISPKNKKEHQLVDDYATWFVNFGEYY